MQRMADLVAGYFVAAVVGVAVQLARREERDARTEFGAAYTRYEANTPAFLPGFGVKAQA